MRPAPSAARLRGVWLAVVVWLVSGAMVTSSAQTAARPAAGSVAQAEAWLRRGDAAPAMEVLSRHLETHPNDLSARLLLAQALLVSGRGTQAEQQYRIILQKSPDNNLALAGLGELYVRTARWQDAEPLLARAVKFSRGQPQLRMEWASVLARLHRFKEASKALTGVAPPRDGTERIAYFRLRAAIAEGLGNAAAAAAAMEHALALQPGDPGLQMATAAAQLQARKFRRAATLAGPIFRETNDAAVGLVLLEAQLGMHENVQSTLASLRAIGMPPDQEVAFRQRLAELLVAHEDFAEAVIDLSQAAALDSSRADLMFNLALAEFKAGRAKESFVAAERAKALNDSAEVEDLLGDIQEALGDYLSAVRSYQAAVGLAPQQQHYRLALALELIRHRSFAPARIVLQQAAKLFPASWQIQLALGMVEYFAGTKQAASQILLHAAKLAPQPQFVLRYLGDIELDEVSAPDPPALATLCQFADHNPHSETEQMDCGALLLHRDYATRDKSHVPEIVRRLSEASQALPAESTPHCELGKLYQWIDQWKAAMRESEICARMDPESAEAHYRLAQIYHHEGQMERWQEEIKRYQAAAQQLADENARHDKALKTFVYTIQSQAAEPR